MNNNNDKIPFKELSKIIDVKDIRSLESTKGFPKPLYKEDDFIFSKEEICKYFNIDNLDEPFIDIKEASKILDLVDATILKHAAKDMIPHYRRGQGKGKKLFFRKSELLALKNELNYLRMSESSINKGIMDKRLRELFCIVLGSPLLKDLTEREISILREAVISNKNLSEIGNDTNLTRERIRQLLEKSFRKIRIKLLHINYINLMLQDGHRIHILERENKLLKQKLASALEEKGLTPEKEMNEDPNQYNHILTVLNTKLYDIDEITVRLLNGYKVMDIQYVWQLYHLYHVKGRNQFLKVRNFGKKSLGESDEIVSKINKLFPDTLDFTDFFTNEKYLFVRTKLKDYDESQYRDNPVQLIRILS